MSDTGKMLTLITLIVLLVLTACGGDQRTLDIRADGWPDGAVISMITDNAVTARTPLYGGRARLPLPTERFRLRAAHPSMLTILTDTLTFTDNTSLQLTAPVARRQFGSWRLGVGFDHPDADSLAAKLCEDSALAFTTLTLDVSQEQSLSQAHAAAVECLLRLDGMQSDDAFDEAASKGFDGIIADLDAIMTAADPEAVYMLLREGTRSRGITLSVRVTIAGSDDASRFAGIAGWYAGLQEGQSPDELRLAFRSDEDVPVVTADRIEETVSSLTGSGIPLDAVSIDLTPAAVKYRVMPDGSLARTDMQHGEVAFLFAIVSGTPGVRLRDGSLRIGSRGSLFVVEDCESLRSKIARLRNGPLSASSGVHIVFDGYGILPDAAGMEGIADAVISPESVMYP